jgi:peptide/nickel transport system substrate-binding protein
MPTTPAPATTTSTDSMLSLAAIFGMMAEMFFGEQIMQRRSFLSATASLLAAPAIARAQTGAGSRSVLRFVPDADLAVMDPGFVTAYQTRDHGFLVYDTLFGQDQGYAARPQMLEGFVVGRDGLEWRLTLRPGLVFHDGERVLARDAVASIRRWARRDVFGQALAAVTDEMSAPDDRTIVIRLKEPFPLLPDALAKTSPMMCAIMPARIADGDPSKPITDPTGSGPYRYNAAERIAGARVVYDRFAGYVPRQEQAERTAGGKVAHFERVEWTILQDPATASAALQRGEVDWWYTPQADLLPLLQRSPGVALRVVVPTGTIATMRLNHTQPPFNNPALRRALFGAITQSDYMIAVNGEDRRRWNDNVGYFCPGTPMASTAGMEALTGPRDFTAVKRAIAASGYKGEKILLMAPQDIASVKALAEVTADVLKRLDLNVEVATMDWASSIQRRFKTGTPAEGGWSIFQTSWAGSDHINPAGHAFLRGNGRDAAPGWPEIPAIEDLRNSWLRAGSPAQQKQLAEQMQLQAFQHVPYIPLGQTITTTAHRGDLSGMLDGLPLFWGIKRNS